MSQVSLCNQALTSLGATPILSIDDDTTEAKLCKLHYQPTLESMLEAASWSFATKRMELPKSSEAPPSPWTSQFLIPTDILRIIEAGDSPNFDAENSTQWQIEGQYIVTDSEKCYIRAITRNIAVNNFTTSFSQAFTARLAAEMCLAITQSQSTTNSQFQKAGELMQMAITLDSMQGRTRKLRSNKYLSARRGSGGAFFTLIPPN